MTTKDGRFYGRLFIRISYEGRTERFGVALSQRVEGTVEQRWFTWKWLESFETLAEAQAFAESYARRHGYEFVHN